MSIYLSNYWTLYKEFVETFSHLKFREIPIVLLTNFYQQIDSELKMKMEEENFHLKINAPKLDQEKIQPYFEKWLEKIRASWMVKPKEGKVLINADYTRIPEQTYMNKFDPGQTLILSRSKGSHIYGIPCENMGKYVEVNHEESDKLVKEATNLFESFTTHLAFGNEFFQQTFIKRIPQIVNTLGMVFNLFEKQEISSIVVGTTEDMQSRALSIVGSSKGIRSVCLQHGILMGEEAFMPVFTNIVGVYGDYEKNWYAKRGLSKERVAELGHPKFDEIFMDTATEKVDLIKKYGLDPNKQTLLVITGPQLDVLRFEALMEGILNESNFQIIIKPHPWEMGKKKYGMYLELEEKYDSLQVYTSRDNHLYELLSHSDGVVSSLSTVALESILFNKPVFIFNFLKSNRHYDYFDILGEYIQEDPTKLTEVIKNYYHASEHRAIYHSIRNRFIADSYIDRHSGQKLADLINKKG